MSLSVRSRSFKAQTKLYEEHLKSHGSSRIKYGTQFCSIEIEMALMTSSGAMVAQYELVKL
jgi:hypothetical protein